MCAQVHVWRPLGKPGSQQVPDILLLQPFWIWNYRHFCGEAYHTGSGIQALHLVAVERVL